ncbi:hypothetical protein [uncultured Methylobacterium sp.]|jgi:hypothetical protein|uniref:hypothetical protein n=1 Tax=uncultured Methylobacterium sp. TaxID=157278 RepID=UPI00262499C5|nr:hypothetical protein [uncultured Methylobacterium sp.]
MSYNAHVFEIMIASPSDVPDERQIIREVINEWNVLHSRDRKTILMPIGWETHSAPDLSDRPQQIINDRLLSHTDILVGIFWTRLGSHTGKAASGTVEEIEQHLSDNRPVMLYFSDTPVALSSVDREQYEKLNEFKVWAMKKGLIETYTSKKQFRDKFRRHLSQTMTRVIGEQKPNLVENIESFPSKRLSAEALELLKEAVKDEHGMVLHRAHIAGEGIHTNRRQLNEENARSSAIWVGAKNELISHGFLVRTSEAISKVTRSGYDYIENTKS